MAVTVITKGRSRLDKSESVTVRCVNGWHAGVVPQIASIIGNSGARLAHLQYQTAAFGMSPVVNALPLLLRIAGVRAPFVTTFHDLRPPYLFPKAGPFRRMANHLLIGSSQASIFIDPADLVRAHARRPAVWIPIGPNILPVEPIDREAARKQLGFGPEQAILAFFGFVNSSKGVETLLCAAERLVREGLDIRLLFVGEPTGLSDPTNRATASRVEQLAKSLGLANRLERTGPLAPALISTALGAADIAVLPYRDGASLRRGSLLACFAHSLPVVTTFPQPRSDSPSTALIPPFLDVSSFQIDEQVAALVSPGDDAALARAIRDLINDPSRAAGLAWHGRQLVDKLQWPTIAAATADVYRRVLGTMAPAQQRATNNTRSVAPE